MAFKRAIHLSRNKVYFCMNLWDKDLSSFTLMIFELMSSSFFFYCCPVFLREFLTEPFIQSPGVDRYRFTAHVQFLFYLLLGSFLSASTCCSGIELTTTKSPNSVDAQLRTGHVHLRKQHTKQLRPWTFASLDKCVLLINF